MSLGRVPCQVRSAPGVSTSSRVLGESRQHCHKLGHRLKPRSLGGVEGTSKKKAQVVVEHLMLLRLDPDRVGQDEAKTCIENLWSLQYQVGGVICSSAGANNETLAEHLSQLQVKNREAFGYYTHAVHFRFPGTAQLDAFLASPVLSKMQEEEVAARCSDMMTISFEASIPEDLFAIFRKGQDWDEGYEHLALMECEDTEEMSQRMQEMQEFVQKYQPSMEEYGLQQLTYGKACSNGKNQIGKQTQTLFA